MGGGIASGPWLQEACFPEGQGLEGTCSESHAQPPALVNKKIGRENTNWELVPTSQKIALEWIPRHTRLYTWTHIYTNSNAKVQQPAASGLYKDPLSYLSITDGKQLLLLPLFIIFPI